MTKKTRLFSIALSISFFASGVGYCLFSTSASAWLAKKAVIYYFETKDMTVGSVSGNLVKGLRMSEVVLSGPARLAPVDEVRAATVRVKLSFAGSRSPVHATADALSVSAKDLFQSASAERADFENGDFTARKIFVKAPDFFQEMTIEEARGNTESLYLSNLRAKGLAILTRPHTLDIQKIEIGWPLKLENVRNVENGRLNFDSSDVILFYGAQASGELDLNIYSKNIHIRDALDLYYKKDHLRSISGEIENAEIFVRGPVNEIEISGQFRVEKLAYRKFVLSDCNVTALFTVKKLGKENEWRGEASFEGGHVQNKETVVYLDPGRILFAGDPENPSFELQGRSQIHETQINMTLRGSLGKPELRLVSDPPWPEEKLLVMLATGKEWSGSEKALSEGRLTADAAREFLDYFVLGGSGEKLAKRFGIKAISLDYANGAMGLGVKKELSRKVDLNYGLEQNAAEASKKEGSQKVGIDYKMSRNTTVSVEGKKGLKSSELSSDEKSSRQDNSLMMKVRRTF